MNQLKLTSRLSSKGELVDARVSNFELLRIELNGKYMDRRRFLHHFNLNYAYRYNLCAIL